MQPCKPKKCRVCAQIFQPSGRNQWRCILCGAQDLRAEASPLCGCGCGQSTRWSRTKKTWREFVHGHALRQFYKTDDPRAPKAHPNLNKGHLTLYSACCPSCGKDFSSRDKTKIYCSKKCYHEHYSGQNHPFFRDGTRTKYKFLTVDGQFQKEHRVVMAKIIGRSVRAYEVVHHIDGNGQNNETENLFLFHCRRCHNYHHATNAKLSYRYDISHQYRGEQLAFSFFEDDNKVLI